jgi:hypothetical protein
MKCHALLAGTITLAVVFTSFACGSRPSSLRSGLSRSEAMDVITKSEKFTPGQFNRVHLGPQRLRIGLEQGLLRIENPSDDIRFLELTPQGRPYIRAMASANLNPGPWAYVDLLDVQLPRRVVEVTGIADGPGTVGPPDATKAVQFRWEWDWDKAPKELKALLWHETKPSKGEAVLKLYDDGWRAEQVQTVFRDERTGEPVGTRLELP